MKLRSRFKPVIFAFAMFTIYACSGGGGPFDCDDNNTTFTPPPTPQPLISEVAPCDGAVGDTVTIFGAFLSNGPSVQFNGVAATITSATAGKIVVTVPPGATSGNIRVLTSGGIANKDFTVGTMPPVPEVEPNDNVDCSNATAFECKASGTLANVGDKDHFKRMSLAGGQYRITLTPTVVTTVFVDGTGVNLTNGTAVIQVAAGDICIGLTGGTGAYVLRVERIN